MKGLTIALIVLCSINIVLQVVKGIETKEWNISAICGWFVALLAEIQLLD